VGGCAVTALVLLPVACTTGRTAVGRHATSAPATASPTRSPGGSPTLPARSARHFRGVPSVGALFLPGFYPSLHTCTASVVASPAGDVVLTAAHCIAGSGRGYRFAPGYRSGKTPYGVWAVTGAYGAPGWLRHRDPRDDWAFLTVARRRWHGRLETLQQVTGAHRLGAPASRRDRVTVIGYGVGHGGTPIRCTAPVYVHRGYPAFDCGGFVGGTSGSPWLRRTTTGWVVAGEIAGLQQGGCTPSTSYSPALGPAARRTLQRAGRGNAPEQFPPAGSDGCPGT
jgi:V8-like Glu-specific endopeptidase